MNTRIIAALSIALLAGGVAMAADMAGMKMDSPAAGAEKGQTAHAVGVVKGLDAAKGTITLAHEPIPEIKWPAMTMGFKATGAQISSVKVGDRVTFEFVAKGMDATIVSISKAK